jgi:hypothetical protein
VSKSNRRDFLKHAAQLGAVAGAADLTFLRDLPSLTAQQVQVPRTMVQLNPDVEPLVRLIESTQRDRVLEAVAERIRAGTTYQPLLAALMLAGVRGIRPRPVGFKFHAVLVVNSAHLASLNAQGAERWLPLFWAIDNFKVSQERNRQEGDWVMPVVQENQLPHTREQSLTAFRTAMDNWNEEGADRAVAALARSCGANEVYELFWRYGARDFRDIGHKAIFVANSYRLLQTIGWRHAEPIVRSLAYALLEHEGTNPAQRDADQDRPWRDNQRRAESIRADWQFGQPSAEASTAMLATLRTGSSAEACAAVVAKLNDRVAPASLWDAMFLCAGELLMRQPGIIGLHTVTSTNALRFAYDTSANDTTRRLMLLQTAAFLPMFRQSMAGRGQVGTVRVDTLEAAAPTAQGAEAIGEIFADVGRNDRLAAARKTLSVLTANPQQVPAIMAAARRLVFAKGTDSHDYKFSSAVLEDFYNIAPAWRNRFLASSMYWLKGAAGADSPVLQRTRAALAG